MAWAISLLVCFIPSIVVGIFLIYYSAETPAQQFIGLMIALLCLVMSFLMLVEGAASVLMGKFVFRVLKLSRVSGGLLLVLSLLITTLGIVDGLAFVTNNLDCFPRAAKLVGSPFNQSLLAKCPLTKPLAGFVSKKTSAAREKWFDVLYEYIPVFSINLPILAFVIAWLSGGGGVPIWDLIVLIVASTQEA